MRNTHLSQKHSVSKKGTGGFSIKPVAAKNTPELAAGKAGVPPPVEQVSERFPALEEQEIVLTFLAPEAKEVNVAGTFNNWSPAVTPLKNTGNGEWVVRLMLRSGQYEYRFVVDGRWCEDPEAVQRVANPHGDFNSVLIVALEVRISIL